VELTKFIKHILTKIDNEVESNKTAFAEGKIILDNYQKTVGQVNGLLIAKEIIKQTAGNLEEFDE
jgi:hypothetical protein|tara:strand:- start:167 stop:361 length:195 start_codon:yes stop_codon:yes gene_type:complete